MATHSAIEWTDTTWSPVIGCDRVSPGCDSCYAITTARIRSHNPNPKIAAAFAGTAHRTADRLDWTGNLNLLENRLTKPLTWPKPAKIFVNSVSDIFHQGVPEEFIAKIWAIMALTPRHTYQILTKRHARMRAVLTDTCRCGSEHAPGTHFRSAMAWAVSENNPDRIPGLPDDAEQRVTQAAWPLPNVWIGVSAENQQWAGTRVPALLQTPAAVRFVSCEPLIGAVDLTRWLRPVPDCGYVDPDDGTCGHPDAFTPECHRWADCPVRGRSTQWHGLDWVIAGGESGHGARPMHPQWARALRDECEVAGVPFFFKQWGAWAPSGYLVIRSRPEARSVLVGDPVDGHGHRVEMRLVGKRAAGRELDGATHDVFPERSGH
ncbi:phage Gp37/Gp68 family protein [Streptomyces mordarskii]|uniref:Phage Gp37/Gp68 family protein n=1 Tax=Streptomyces mordarskii TaxID=1226758 RepID=A0ABP3PT46_9ACTN